jgi:hypothetical protein
MKIALFGATGHLGQIILDEALSRGHAVTAIVRDPARLTRRSDALSVAVGDVAQPSTWLEAIRGSDAMVASLSARRDGNVDAVPANASLLLDNLPKAGVMRLLWVGGAASLEVSPGVRLIDDPQFPADWKAEANAQSKALDVFRASKGDIEWTYVSPAALIEDGERTGSYRLGGNQLLTDANGISRISVADYAVAMIDRIEQHDALRQRITVAY